MSKASEWAHHVTLTREAYNQANKARPEFSLDGGRLNVYVMELGQPKLVAGDGRNMEIEIRPEVEEFVQFGLRIIETFVDEDIDLKLLRRIAGLTGLFGKGLTAS